MWKQFPKGKRLFAEGDPVENVYFIDSGAVKLVKEYSSGKNAILGMMGPGALVAEVAAVDGKPYPATCVAMEDCRAGAIPAKVFVELLRKEPDVAIKIISSVGGKLRELTSNLGFLAVQTVDKRLARFLYKLAQDIGEKSGKGCRISLGMTRKDIAEIIGTSFEVVERCLKKMRDDGLIQVDGKKIDISDLGRLAGVFED
ncbi:MAG: Crp/Fnr family transcriptional regulator [Nitrospinae bacterium]|nr:Crp/Fnr family transcriptional regulator [Nitrospinota bacterium]